MGSSAAIAAVGTSIARYLSACFLQNPPVEGWTTTVTTVRTEDFEPDNAKTKLPRPALSLFFYRIDFNKTMRAAWSAVGHHDGRAHLPLDLHFLITAWGNDAESEYAILGAAIQALEDVPILAGPLLAGTAAFAPTESVQIVLEELSTEAVMRTFDSLSIAYRLSVPYIARVVRVDGRKVTVTPPVLTPVSGANPGGVA
jgi:hypothetical protein